MKNRHSKSRFFCAVKTSVIHILRKKKYKNITKNHYICLKCEEKTVKGVEMHNLLVCAYKSQDFSKIQKKIAMPHDRVTVTFRNSDEEV